jgi:hypothetical protein
VEQCHSKVIFWHTVAEKWDDKPALASPMWAAAMTTEYEALMKNGTWTLVSLLPDGSINKYKWFHDFHQQPGSDYNEKVSLVIKPVYHNSANLDLTHHCPPKLICYQQCFSQQIPT